MNRLMVLTACACALGCNRVDGVTVGAATITKRFTAGNNLDILFVIDNSASTADKQTVFAANLPTFASALDQFPGGRPNVHVGVVSTTVGFHSSTSYGANCWNGDDGLLQNTARVSGCSPPQGQFISDIDHDGTRTTNYTGTLADTLACIGQLGAGGCGFEQPLESMKRALDGSVAANAGFLRPDADLGVVILTDEDDASVADPSLFDLDLGPAAANSDFRAQPLFAYACDDAISATAPGTYTHCAPRTGSYLADPNAFYSFLTSLKDPSQIVFSVVGGDPTPTIATGQLTTPFMQELALLPSCTATINGNFAIARPALRLDALVTAFGDHGVFETVCQSDYSGALTAIGAKLFTMMSPCLEGKIATTGGVPACTVTDRAAFGTPAEVDSVLPACTMLDPSTPAPGGVRPCWWTAPDAQTCGTTQTGLAFHVERAAAASDGTVVDATCAID